MKKCAFLSIDNLEDFHCSDYLVIEALKKLGWQAEEVSWRKANCDWNQYELVIIRSTWDYQDDFETFVDVLHEIEHSSAYLANPLSVVKWNINKQYLQELELNGVDIVPTIWKSKINVEELYGYLEHFNVDEIIIKPCVSANADDTFRINGNNLEQLTSVLVDKFAMRDCMIQPFMSAIVEEGEYSLFYFNNEYSHAILKTPKQQDFRVQEEHGGLLRKIEPELGLLQSAETVLSVIDQNLLYTRLDFVRNNDSFSLMEAELIEPSLYFNLDSGSAERFAKAIITKMDNSQIV